jgi:hypothetical protein
MSLPTRNNWQKLLLMPGKHTDRWILIKGLKKGYALFIYLLALA